MTRMPAKTRRAKSRPGKYEPLRRYLEANSKNEVTLTLKEMELILGESLPPSAAKHRAWWANEVGGTHTHAEAWLLAGWEVAGIELGRETTFRRRAAADMPREMGVSISMYAGPHYLVYLQAASKRRRILPPAPSFGGQARGFRSAGSADHEEGKSRQGKISRY